MTEIGLKYLQHQENVRANKAKEQLTRAQTAETHFANLETARANLVKESQTQQSLDEAHRSNIVREMQNASSILETHRANLAKEQETYRSNLAKETETVRSNKAKENETHRANVVKEEQTWTQMERDFLNTRSQIEETQRHNRKMEANDELKAYAAFNNAQTNYAKSFSEIYKNIMDPTFKAIGSIGGLVK